VCAHAKASLVIPCMLLAFLHQFNLLLVGLTFQINLCLKTHLLEMATMQTWICQRKEEIKCAKHIVTSWHPLYLWYVESMHMTSNINLSCHNKLGQWVIPATLHVCAFSFISYPHLEPIENYSSCTLFYGKCFINNLALIDKRGG
jgi:hypothetical protein